MLVTMIGAARSPRHVAIVAGAAGPEGDDTRALIATARAEIRSPDLLLVLGGGASHARTAELVPFARPLVAREGRATAYVCVDGACHAPTHDPKALAADLART